MNVATTYNPALVGLSFVIAVFASYTALDLGGRIRMATGWISAVWVASAAVAMGGGIWSMHFVAMLAFEMAIPASYDLWLTALSLVLAIAVTAAAFAVAGRENARPTDIVLSGFFMGLGIVGMHYTGMAAMRTPAHLNYNPLLVALSVAIAIGAATISLVLAGRRQNLPRMLVAAMVMGLAIAGMHYSGMAAATFRVTASGEHEHGAPAFEQAHLALAIAATTILLLCLALTASFYDRRMRRADQRLRILLQGVTDYAIFLLDPGGNIASWSAGAQRMKEYTADEIIGQHFSCFYTQDDIASGEPWLALETARRNGRYESEGWRLKKNGSKFWANVIIDCIRDEDGGLMGFAKVTRDMTDRREAQQKLDQAREQLFQAQKMEAIGQLTGGVAHDFNNLLTITLGNLEMAKRFLQSGKPADALTNIERAEAGSLRAAALTDRLVTFARQQALQPRPIDPNQIVSNLCSMIRPTVGENIEVKTILTGGVWWISADPNQLESALLNLVINARDAMSAGGKLTIETANADLDEAYAVRHSEVLAGQYALIAVTDTGTGMSPEVAARAFEPFYTTKPIGQGSGLGLSQVFGFVKQSGGHVKICSTLDQGTSVRIYLPRHVGERSQQLESRELPSVMPRAPSEELILVVEDEAAVRAFSRDVLTELGYRVIEAEDAQSGLAALGANPDIMLLFTDIGLSGMSGRELASEALRRCPSLRVLYTSGHTSDAIIHHGADLLTKPFNMMALASKVREVIRRPVSG